MLNNRAYIGEAIHKGTGYAGEHERLIDQRTWEQVQSILQQSPRLRANNTRTETPALLKGLLYGPDEEKGTGLRLPAVKVSLLDPASTPLLNSLRLRNEAVQKVIRLLSLRSTGKSTGRIPGLQWTSHCSGRSGNRENCRGHAPG